MQNSWWITIVAAYLLGSIPFGLLMGLARGVDIRGHGSGNVGATNAWRVLGPGLGVSCFVLDFFKGLGPALWAGWYHQLFGARPPALVDQGWWLAVAVAAVVGHVFPVWLKFRGGKGVATALGAVCGFWPFLTLPALGAVIVWLVVLAGWHYVGLASVAGAVAMPLLALGAGWWNQVSLADSWPLVSVSAVLALLIVVRHRSNLREILAGTEEKFTGRQAGAEPEKTLKN